VIEPSKIETALDFVQRKENIESFDEYESGKTNIYVKGRLNNSFSFWENIGTSDFILSVNKDGYRIPLLNCPPKICLSNNKSSFEDSIFVEKAILDLLKGGLVKTVSNRPHVVNPLTVSFNGKGKERLILDLRHVNKHVRLDKFKFEDWKTLGLKSFEKVYAIDLSRKGKTVKTKYFTTLFNSQLKPK
jgi:hypothetical protein